VFGYGAACVQRAAGVSPANSGAAMTFEENKALFGHDPAERIVAVEFDGGDAVTIYIRADDGSTTIERGTLRPFLWTQAQFDAGDAAWRRLEGDLTLGFLAECENWQQFSKLRLSLKKTDIPNFALNDPAQQFLLQSGKTLFKGVQFDELRRMQIAIEAFSGAGMETADPHRASDHLMSIAVSDNSGWEEVIFIDPANPDISEQAALEKLTAIVQERDPDVIEGHDLFKVTLPYLAARAKRAKVRLAWGRDGSAPASRASRVQVAEKTIDYPKFRVHGRHLVDTFLLAQFYDVSARELESYELDDVSRHFHIPCEDKLAARDKQAAWLGEPEKFQRHALQSLRQTRMLAATLSGSYFIQAKIFPYLYQDVVVRGNATKIDALLLREYYRRSHSIPDLPTARAFEGGYTDIFFTGVARGVWHCDIASLYPSVMLRFDCFPAHDRLGLFRGLLADLRKFRLEAKAQMRDAAAPARKAELQALQSTFKILINSFYGYLGFAQAHFADYDAASRVTQTGRDLLKKMVAWLQSQGAQVIEIDTDGIYFVPPKVESVASRPRSVEPASRRLAPEKRQDAASTSERTDSAPGIDSLQRGLAAILPEGIEVEFDARFAAMFSYKAKNYALLTDDGELHITGAALKSRGLEKFQRVFLEQMIRLLMDEKFDDIEKLRADFERNIRERAWPIEMLMKTDTLQDSLNVYAQKIESSSRNRAAAYELALKSGRPYQPGDRVSYYITGAKKNVSAYENSKLAADWDPNARDENVEYYVAKLNELAKKFAAFAARPAGDDAAQMGLL
jgi:DNA polymerase, archaea type